MSVSHRLPTVATDPNNEVHEIKVGSDIVSPLPLMMFMLGLLMSSRELQTLIIMMRSIGLVKRTPINLSPAVL